MNKKFIDIWIKNDGFRSAIYQKVENSTCEEAIKIQDLGSVSLIADDDTKEDNLLLSAIINSLYDNELMMKKILKEYLKLKKNNVNQ